jgi:hypothetical protein
MVPLPMIEGGLNRLHATIAGANFSTGLRRQMRADRNRAPQLKGES